MKIRVSLTLNAVFLTMFLICLSACKKDHPNPVTSNPDGSTIVSNPITIDVFPVMSTANSGKIYLQTVSIGNDAIVLPITFDTGSAGLTLRAQSIFPSTMVDSTGFKFQNGKDTIQYKGITITNIKAQKNYGSTATVMTQETGNIGYATLAVGDANGVVKMKKMPILFYYSDTGNGVEKSNPFAGTFGVNTSNNGAPESADSTQVYPLVSPLKYLQYTNGILAGYKLAMVTLEGCDINTVGSCVPKALLTIGLTVTDESGYAINTLNISNPQPVYPQLAGTPSYPNYSTFDPTIPGCLITNSVRRKTTNVLLDTGNPGVNLNLSKDSLNISNYPNLSVTTPSNTVFSYNYNTVSFNTAFDATAKRSVFGIYFFTNFNFLEDYQNGRIGLK